MLGTRRVDRYVAREVLGPLAIGFSLFTFLLLMNAFFLVAQQTISKNLGWDLAFPEVARALALHTIRSAAEMLWQRHPRGIDGTTLI